MSLQLRDCYCMYWAGPQGAATAYWWLGKNWNWFGVEVQRNFIFIFFLTPLTPNLCPYTECLRSYSVYNLQLNIAMKSNKKSSMILNEVMVGRSDQFNCLFWQVLIGCVWVPGISSMIQLDWWRYQVWSNLVQSAAPVWLLKQRFVYNHLPGTRCAHVHQFKYKSQAHAEYF